MAFMTCECCKGACCKDGACTPETQQDCLDMGGTFLGYGVQCYEGICDGACCAPDGTCTTTYREACTDEFIGEGVGCDTSPCELPCEEVGCAPCSCCVEGECEEAVCPSPTVDSASWCGVTGLDAPGAFADLGCSGNLYCDETETNNGSYSTTGWGDVFSLIETVACGGTQTTTIPGNPSIASGNCRYIYEIVVIYGHGVNAADDPCYKRRYLGYLDTNPCSPSGGPLTIVEDTSQAFDGTTFDPCDFSESPPGCAEGCIGLCPDPPSVEISFPP